MYLTESQKSLSRSIDRMTGDCVEALIGAIFLDSGIKDVEEFILKLWKKFIDNSKITLVDSKTKLQEYSLKKYKELPKYTFYKKTGPQHKPFKTDVQIPHSKKIIGTGTSKKSAQQNAATKLLKTLNIMNWEDECYLLNKIKFRENANIINVFTQNKGKVGGIVYGGNSRKIRNYLQISNKLFISHNSKSENKIGYFKTELIKAITPLYFNDKKRTSALISLCSLLNLLLPEEQPYKKSILLMKNSLIHLL